METEAGVKLTDEEVKLIKSLKRLAKKWKSEGNDLWLFSASGTLNVMLKGGTKRNTNPEHLISHGVNPENSITTIDIMNDGGDW